LADVQTGFADAERDAEDAKQQSRAARERFLDLKKKRCDISASYASSLSAL